MKNTQNTTFLLTGTYSSFNKGDAAMQIATAAALKKRWPHSRIIIATPFPEFDKDLYNNYEIIKSNRRRLVYSSVSIFFAYLYKVLTRLGINANFLLRDREMRAIKDASVVIDLSGDTITEDYGPHVTYSHLIPLILAQQTGTPVYICAQSMGPFKITTWLVKKVLKQCAGVTAREKVTFQYMKSLGIPDSILHHESDMAFLLNPASDQVVADIIKAEKLQLSQPTLGITVSEIIRNKFNSQSSEEFYVFFARVIDSAIKNFNLNVIFFGHVTGPSRQKDDRITARNVYEHIQQKDSVFVVEGNYSPSEIKGVIKKCDIFLGARMHSNIAAISTSIPTIAMSYSHKTIGIMDSVGLADYVYPGNELSEEGILEIISKTLNNSTDIRKQLKTAIPKIQASSLQNIHNIEKIIKN